MNVDIFKETVWQKGRELYRDMPWRNDTSPYFILVSELMLQQTQVERVIPKFHAFVEAFPTINDLAKAPLSEVLILWNGLGYNRRAKYLHDAAKKIVDDYDGTFPDLETDLQSLPGVGKNTAGAIMTYAFNKPSPFIETNVRTVYFHHFFNHGAPVSDKELLEVVKKTIDNEHPRQFYWALMDYGNWLKRQGAGRISQSSSYRKQAPLKGSLREVRGMIIAVLADGDGTKDELKAKLPQDDRFDKAFDGLIRDGLVMQTGAHIHLTK